MIQRVENPAPNGKPPKMVQVAPNRFAQLELDFEVPETVFCDVVPVPGHPGHFQLVPRSWEKLVRLDEDLAEKLGMGRETFTLRKLIRSGFIGGSRVSPKVYNIDVASFFRHMKACAEDPDYWENTERLEVYNTAY